MGQGLGRARRARRSRGRSALGRRRACYRAGSLDTAARFLLFHAPALLGAAALAGMGLIHPGAGRAAGFALALGLALFSGDLALRALGGGPLSPLAAPTGGFVLMLGWGLIAVAAVLPAKD